MPRKFLAAAALAVVSATVLLVSAATAQNPPAPAVGTTDAGDWLRRGRLLETERRWGEALAHYEDGLRQFPSDGGLKRQFDLARLHYELCRRCNDRSFREGLARLPAGEALDLYGEVLLKIQAHHVDAPHWKDLVEFGTRAMEVALVDPAFLEANRSAATAPGREAFGEELRGMLAGRRIASRDDARAAVSAAANLALQRLGLSPTALVMEYTCGTVSFLDQYSAFLTPDQLNEIYSQIEGNFVGLGVELKVQDAALTIVRVISNSPAKRAGIHEGDRILAVNGQTTENLSTDRAANLLQGDAGSVAELVVAGPGQVPRQVSIRRQRVEVPSVDEARVLSGRMGEVVVDPAWGIAYLKLVCFQKTTFRDLEAALWNLNRTGMKRLIVDLRGNPGGLLTAAVDASDLFLDRGVIVSTRGRNSHENLAYPAHEAGTWHVPLAVVIDRDSASAAEIFAGAMQEHRRGTIVGARSFGKGSVQSIISLNAGHAGLRLTTAKFYSPSGRPYSGAGIEPDLVPHQVARPAGPGQSPPPPADPDPALAAAIQAVMQPLAPQ